MLILAAFDRLLSSLLFGLSRLVFSIDFLRVGEISSPSAGRFSYDGPLDSLSVGSGDLPTLTLFLFLESKF